MIVTSISPFLQIELKQGPADLVIPVFSPKNPETFSNLFVLVQVYFLESHLAF